MRIYFALFPIALLYAAGFHAAEAVEGCSPVICTLFCEFGFKRDAKGCEICDCNEKDLCPLMFCPGICRNSRCIQVLPKPGTCPKPTGFGICVDLCSGDDSCPGSQKCCSNGCGHVCTNPILPAPKPGFCPKPTGPGICVEACSGDHSCADDLKCCSNGCGHVCMKPVDEKPGICPKLPISDFCIKGCPGDGGCPGDLKCCKRCCKQGCGGVCVKPLPCDLDTDWRGSISKGKKQCLNCSCVEILLKGKKLMKKACRRKAVRKACCPLCKNLKNL